MDNNRLNAVFIGGSITEGGGASSRENSWVSLVGEYLKKTFKEKEVHIINAGVGGTGSYLGVFRLQKDVIAHDPDIVFIEFAVNDMGYKCTPWISSICMEGIVRQLTSLRKIPVVVFIFTPSYHANAFSSVHKKIAYYYHIPFVDLQDEIWKQIGRGDFQWSDIEIDEVHPNDRGHKIFADLIIHSMENDRNAFFAKPMVKEDTITGFAFKNPRLDRFQSAVYTGNWTDKAAKKPRLGTVNHSNLAGDSLEYHFSGRCIGLYHTVSPASGIIDVTIDDRPMSSVDFYKSSETDYCLLHHFQLEEGHHRIKIEVSDKKNEKSSGYNIEIGYFMIE